VTTFGYQVATAESGEQALSWIQEHACDAILLDIRMAGIDGLVTLSRIIAMTTLIPVIMVTATDDIETAVGCMRDGAFDYIVKPVRRVILKEALARALRHRSLVMENQRLAEENARHREYLEQEVQERTSELSIAYDQLKKINFKTVKVLAETIEAKDPYTRGHCHRVHILSKTMAQHLDYDSEAITAVEYGSLLHDIGKIGVPETILNKPAKLSWDEFQILKEHPLVGEQILRPLEFFSDCLPIVRNHHERYDGEGYPDGLSGGEIPATARIVAITDAYDAMTSTRSYRTAMRTEEAIERIEAGIGSQFDPELARLFIDERVCNTVSNR
jgi:putative two-component system response regulator